jgi:GT2 family glycosyltransferase
MTSALRTDATLVIPVYGAIDETIACIETILASDGAACPILVNDDGSAAYVGDTLRRHFANSPNVSVRTNFRNRGYTANVKYGVEAATTPYVAVINSDTLFPRRWLGKFAATLDENPAIAAVGPLSNAASYQNIPSLIDPRGGFSSNPDFGLEHAGREAVNLFLEAAFAHRTEDLPILNGFCTMFRASSLRKVGGFDADAFPTGYGEENDVCMRLLAGGHRLAVRLDCFVHHLKSRSFGSELKREYSRLGRETLDRLYGEGFVPRFAEEMDRNSVLNAVRFTVSAALGSADGIEERARAAMGETGEVRDPPELVRIEGPCTVVVWPDSYLLAPGDDSSMSELPLELTLGGQYLRLIVPPGRKLAFSGLAPLRTMLGMLAVQSACDPIILRQVPAAQRSPEIRAAIEKLEFRLLYYAEDLGNPASGVP